MCTAWWERQLLGRSQFSAHRRPYCKKGQLDQVHRQRKECHRWRSQNFVIRERYRFDSQSILDLTSTQSLSPILLLSHVADCWMRCAQGEVESIAQMKPKGSNDQDEGLLEYLEDIIGTAR